VSRRGTKRIDDRTNKRYVKSIRVKGGQEIKIQQRKREGRTKLSSPPGIMQA
jgi:hypothetical protein